MSLDDWFFARHLEEDEAVVKIVHRHWFLGLRELFWPVLALLAGVALLAAAPYRSIAIAVGIWTACVLLWILRNFFDYYLDAWIITDHGIVDVAWHGWFHRESSRILYSDVQGVSHETQGIFATLFRYGTVAIEKISTGSTVALETVPRPRAVESIILKQMERYLHTKNLKDSKHVQEVLAGVIANQMQLQELDEDQEGDEE